MTYEEFEILVARHGTDPARWPDRESARDPQVARWLDAERALDARLRLSAPAPLSGDMAERVLAALPSELPPERSARPVWWGAVAAGLVAAGFGATLLTTPPQVSTEDELWMEFAEDAGFEDLWDWVYDG